MVAAGGLAAVGAAGAVAYHNPELVEGVAGSLSGAMDNIDLGSASSMVDNAGGAIGNAASSIGNMIGSIF